MTRGDCVSLVESIGWPTPPRSSCWMCPNKTKAEWQELKLSSDWEKAVKFEEEIRKLDDDLYLTQGGKTLEDADLDAQPDMFTGKCDSGMCFV